MSKQQRAAVNQMLGRTRPSEGLTIEQPRAGFAAMMATMRISAGVTTSAATPARAAQY